jgi:hypothetical protein
MLLMHELSRLLNSLALSLNRHLSTLDLSRESDDADLPIRRQGGQATPSRPSRRLPHGPR